MYSIQTFEISIPKLSFPKLNNLFSGPIYQGDDWDAFWNVINATSEQPTNFILYNFSVIRQQFPKDAKFLDDIIREYNRHNKPSSIIQFDYLDRLIKGKIESIFSLRPFQYGLRGDPELWNDLECNFIDVSFPTSEQRLVDRIHDTTVKLTGKSTKSQKNFFVEKYNNGGMSSGTVCWEFWEKEAIPLLIGRFRHINCA